MERFLEGKLIVVAALLHLDCRSLCPPNGKQ